jgi:hypothetical protein
MQRCDVAVSPSDESSSETGDADVQPNYSISDDSDSDTSDCNSSSSDEVNCSAQNEPQNVDFMTEGKQEQESKERKRNFQTEWNKKN